MQFPGEIGGRRMRLDFAGMVPFCLLLCPYFTTELTRCFTFVVVACLNVWHSFDFPLLCLTDLNLEELYLHRLVNFCEGL